MTYRVAPVAIGTTEHDEAALGPAKLPHGSPENQEAALALRPLW